MRSRRSSSGASRASSAPRPDGTPTDGLVIQDVAKRFGRFPALAGVSLQVQPGEFLALLGPSGSGKTTLLRIIGGLEQPDAGSVSLDGDDFLALSARERRVGMVFQHYALFRHMNVAANIAFGLQARPRSQRPPKREIAERVEALLAFMQLDGLGKRYPAQLSGGQRQRVALARAMAIEPRVLLLDEPFGALDAKVRRELRRWLRHVHDETGVTTVFVTHDQEEAMDLADRVAVLREGAIEQVGTPAALAEKPDSAFVFDFLGDANRLPCQISGGLARFGEFTAPVANADSAARANEAWFRPYETELSAAGPGVAVTVQGVWMRGAVVRAECIADDGRRFDAEFPQSDAPSDLTHGARLTLRPRRVHGFAAETS